MSKQNESKVNITLGENPEFDAIALKSLEVIKNRTTRICVSPDASLKFHLRNWILPDRPPSIIEVFNFAPGELFVRLHIDAEDIVEVSSYAPRTGHAPVKFYTQSILLKQSGAGKELHQVHDIPPILKATKSYSILPSEPISAAYKSNRQFLQAMLGHSLCLDYANNQMLKIDFVDKLAVPQDQPPEMLPGIFYNSIVYKITINELDEYEFKIVDDGHVFKVENEYVRLSVQRGIVRFYMKNKDSLISILKWIENKSEGNFFINTEHAHRKQNAQVRYTVMPMLFFPTPVATESK